MFLFLFLYISSGRGYNTPRTAFLHMQEWRRVVYL